MPNNTEHNEFANQSKMDGTMVTNKEDETIGVDNRCKREASMHICSVLFDQLC